ncbi:MAG: N-acetyl-D-Glu racemase DgcA [Pseudomonadota bacterium]
MGEVHILARTESFRLAQAFTIARGSKTEAEVVCVEARSGDLVGRGECVPYARYGESLESVTDQIASLPSGIDRTALQELLPPGAARNAVDCAFWDLEAKVAGHPVWALAEVKPPEPVTTAFTLSLGPADQMAAAARDHAHLPLLKIKLGTPDDLDRLEAVRAAAPKPKIIVDANEGWRAEDYARLAPDLARLGVALVEQPLPAGEDEALEGLPRPVPLCADESCHDRDSLPALAGRYDLVNIKLDKTGGLTEALALRQAARAAGFDIMVGCMVGTSLAMAPALLVAQGAEVVDLDGPLLLAEDREAPLRYEDALMFPPERALWGA